VNAAGQFAFTETNAFSGDNGRAAIIDPEDGLAGRPNVNGRRGPGNGTWLSVAGPALWVPWVAGLAFTKLVAPPR
jgi:hypothetical protein